MFNNRFYISSSAIFQLKQETKGEKIIINLDMNENFDKRGKINIVRLEMRIISCNEL